MTVQKLNDLSSFLEEGNDLEVERRAGCILFHARGRATCNPQRGHAKCWPNSIIFRRNLKQTNSVPKTCTHIKLVHSDSIIN